MAPNHAIDWLPPLQLSSSSKTTKELASNSENKDRSPSNSSEIVKLIGAERTEENIASEEYINGLFLSHINNQIRTCYKNVLEAQPHFSTVLTLYFGVSQNGVFHDISSQTGINPGETEQLFKCISKVILNTRSANLNKDLTFRVNLNFKPPQ